MAMHATVTTWCLRHPPRDTAEFDRRLRALMKGGIELGRRIGVVDVLIVAFDPNMLLIVTLYETLDEAMEAGPHVLHYVREGFADQLELVSRVAGQAFETSQFAPVDRDETQQWRLDAAQMYGNAATWHLDPSIRSPEAFEAFVSDVMAKSYERLKNRGLLDAFGVRISNDELLVLRLCSDPAIFDAIYSEESIAAGQALLNGKISLVEQSTGRAFDAVSIFNEPA
jgi:hypothetical protein